MNGAVPTPRPPKNPLLRRRNQTYTSSSSSISTINTSTSSSSPSSSSSSSQSDFELLSIKPISYISLKDILPATAVNSPRPMTPHQNAAQSPGSEISIRNHLVKQAAWAYLQPMSTSPNSSGNSFLHCLFGGDNPFAALFRSLSSAFDWLLRVVRIRSSR